MQQFPCFGAVLLTFMEKPFIDFKFSLGKLDVMSIGPGDMNVGNMVGDIIHNAIKDMLVFPKKMPVPILYDQDICVSGGFAGTRREDDYMASLFSLGELWLCWHARREDGSMRWLSNSSRVWRSLCGIQC